MSRIKLLQPHEIKEFDCPIVLTTTVATKEKCEFHHDFLRIFRVE